MQLLNFTDKDLKLKLPFGMCISGPSSSGKSSFLMKFIAESADLITPAPRSVLYCFGEFNNSIPVLQKAGVNVYAGVPSEELIQQQPKPLLLVLDDLMLSINENYLADLFTKKSHHQNFAVVFATQNLFDKKIKVARQNSQYIVLMRAPNSALSIKNLGIQLYPGQLPFFMDSYKQATSMPYGYLLLDMHAASDPALRLRTSVFKDDEKIIFTPKNGL